jgi:TRAP-type transport system small permease protein
MVSDQHPSLPPDAAAAFEQPQSHSRLETPEQFILIASLVVLTLTICWGVLSRYIVSAPAAWTEEVTSFAFVWLVFVGAAEVNRRRQHISVDIVTALLPQAIQRVLALVIEVVVIGFSLYAAWLGIQQAIASQGSFTSILRLPLWIGYSGFTVGFLLIAFRSAQYLYRRFQDRRAT